MNLIYLVFVPLFYVFKSQTKCSFHKALSQNIKYPLTIRFSLILVQAALHLQLIICSHTHIKEDLDVNTGVKSKTSERLKLIWQKDPAGV